MELLLPSVNCFTFFFKSSFTFQYGATSTMGICFHSLFYIIYIPIWSYFYKDGKSNDFYLFGFTFQYGATSTNTNNVKEFVYLSFTFQYGATST